MRIKSNKGFTLIELLIVVAIIGIIAAIAIPGLLRARMSANESSAIGSLRSINSAQSTFASSCGGGNYAEDLTVLGSAPSGSTAAFISPDLVPASGTSIKKSGYMVSMGGTAYTGSDSSCNSGGMTTGYNASAGPVSTATGTRHFGTNTTATIWQDTAALTMTDTSAPASAVPVQ